MLAMQKLYDVVRRYLPVRAKRVLKRLLPRRSTVQPSLCALPMRSMEDDLCIWTKDAQLKQALTQATDPGCHEPCVSVVILTYNKLSCTRLCVESIYRNTQYPHFELVIVDNASTDGTRTYLEVLQQLIPNLHVIFNDHNEGFAFANNQGILRSRGEYVVLLNNDTILCPGWLTQLIRYLEQDVEIGIIGPVTNSAGNEQMIRAAYSNIEEFERFAREQALAHQGRTFETSMLGMFCVGMRRNLVDEVGLLDERFGIGTFEDDDYCHRVKLCGYRLICAEGVFIHHFGKATMSKLGEKRYLQLFEHNRQLFERKWGVKWRPHRRRT